MKTRIVKMMKYEVGCWRKAGYKREAIYKL